MKQSKKERMGEMASTARMMSHMVSTLPADESTVEIFSEEIDGEIVTWPARPLRADIAEYLRDLHDELQGWYS
jgi:hypothetical protein